jgi:hypothetical protein
MVWAPIVHTMEHRYSAYPDFDNQFGYGPNALIAFAGLDKSKSIILAKSIIEYFEGLR